MHIGILTIHFRLDSCRSLKDKRSLIKPLQERARKEFNVTVAEVDLQDSHQNAVIAFGFINNDYPLVQSVLNHLIDWIDQMYPDLWIQDQNIEIQ